MCVLCVTCCIAFQVVKLAAIKFSEEDYPNAKVCVYVCVCMYMCVCVCVCVCGYLRDEALLHVTFSSSSLFLVAGGDVSINGDPDSEYNMVLYSVAR